MITTLMYWSDTKMVFSSSNDGTLIVWTNGAIVFDKIKLGGPIFSMAINYRRQLLACGFKKLLSVYPLDEKKKCGHVINCRKSFSDNRHKDIVSCIVSLDSQIYTAGYDRKFLIYDTYHTSDSTSLTVVHCNSQAHEAAITQLLLVRDHETTRFLSGSFDRTIGIWSQDGQLIQRLFNFTGETTGMCYVASVKYLWISNGTSQPVLVDPHSGDVISDFVDTFQNPEDCQQVQQLTCLPDSSHVIGSTRNNSITIWKYNMMGCVTVLHSKHPLECLAYTGKKLLLIFTGDSKGIVEKWKRNDLSTFTYSKESYTVEDKKSPARKRPQSLQQEKVVQNRRPISRLQRAVTAGSLRKRVMLNIPKSSNTHKCYGYTRSVFTDELDVLAMATDNGEIQLWVFDDTDTSLGINETPSAIHEEQLTEKYDCSLANVLGPEICSETNGCSLAVNKFLSGFTCKKTLSGHLKAVSALALVGCESGYNTVYLLSGGWDRRLCVWDLHTCSLIETFSRPELDHWSEDREAACDGAILDLCYSPKRKEFAYSSSDGNIYIRRFATISSQMSLVNVITGHEAEVTSIVWHHHLHKWISGSEDGTIRIWSEEGSRCESILVTKEVVTCICIDQVNGCIVAGVQDTVRVYDPVSLLQVQYNIGHTDLIRSLVHIPEMNKYVSASWDKTVRMWKAHYKKPENI
ncbi:hypothetical protein GDO86_005520 [Hymenochirus boettgeri]|uniref:Uncharacterized protein n=1 Tax=Hymenochirus boettgeri TaxID=247094 RepID=A0A8T2J796_9PIPI|nr:hypothetical protein GDO86_005520 [Hymenochirus boettgeri]